MRNTFFAGLAFAALSTSAFAADMPAYPQEAAAVSGFDWSGAYVGVHGGWAFGELEIALAARAARSTTSTAS